MSDLKSQASSVYHHHFFRYLVVGGTSFVIDFGLLFLFRIRLHTNLSLATSIGYWTSILFNFFAMRSWTFSAGDKKNLHKHALTYGILLAFNYLFTVIFVNVVTHSLHSLDPAKALAVAKVGAVAIQTCWNYFIYKNYIFTKKEHKSTSEDSVATTPKA